MLNVKFFKGIFIAIFPKQLLLKWDCLLKQLSNGILLPKLFLPSVRKYCSSDLEKLLKCEAEG